MKLPLALLATAMALSLTACGGRGGGGDDGTDATFAPATSTQTAGPTGTASPTEPAVSLAEFEGTWRRDDAHNACLPDFPYNDAYAYRLRDITLQATADGALEAAVAVLVYGDDSCNAKQGLVTERFRIDLASTPLSGRDNVLKGSSVFLDYADGLGITFATPPQGSASGLAQVKLIGDVHNGQLQLTTVDMGVAPDAEGFPSGFVADEYFVRCQAPAVAPADQPAAIRPSPLCTLATTP